MAPTNISDPMNNFIYEAHQYMDSDYSGTSSVCPSTTIGSDGLGEFTTFLKQYNVKGIIGEFGAGDSTICLEAIQNIVATMEANSDVYLGTIFVL
jgi:endoglucanase